MRKLRQYQTDAIESVENELIVREKSKCLVKMFCGTGKSIVMYQLFVLRIVSPLTVFVFPSLALIDQFYTDYIVKLKFNLDSVIKVSSEVDSTTDEDVVCAFLSNDSIKQKIVCITYQSFEVLLNCGKAIDVACFDEAHHAVGQVSQKLIFNNDTIKKQVFFTATPKNENGIVMYDADDESKNMCGKLVYDYTYLNGVWEGYLNPFEIRMDFYMENTNKSVYESIARAVLVSGNSRVLTFHSAVDSESESTTSVKNFVDLVAFKSAFDWVIESEFPEKRGVYASVKMCGLYAQIKASERKKILKEFDKTPDNEVYVISSCQTIGEGVDTKNANMCVFVDPKSSYTGIIQNIGRIVRKVEGVAKPNSTILLPCWVDKEKYIGCGGDREKQDEVIRRDMSESGGNFNAILNVMSALKQEDEDLYEICLYYPDCYAPVEIYSSLERQGLRVDEEACEGDVGECLEHLLEVDVGECLEHLLEVDVEYEEDESDADVIMRVADENGVCVEVHTNSLEVPIERFNDGEKREYVRMYRDEEGKYMPIVDDKEERKKSKKRSDSPPNRANRFKTNVHTNPDVKVLWGVIGDVEIGKEISSCVIDCEVVKYDPMEKAVEIVERARERESNGGRLIPRNLQKKNKTHEEEQEYKDSKKLQRWKQALKGNGETKCSYEVCDYLDANLPGWRDELDEKAMEYAKNIVKRAKQREACGVRLIPRNLPKKNKKTHEEEQEHKDAVKLGHWKQALKGKEKSKCPPEVRDYLDENLPGWRDEVDFDEKATEDAKKIVKRAREREASGGRLIPKQYGNITNRTLDEEQERKDAGKLGNWKKALKGSKQSTCSSEVRDYLDVNLPGWRDDDFDEKAMKCAKNIVKRAKEREASGGRLIPRQFRTNNITLGEEQENKDATKLSGWKQSLKGKGTTKCPTEVRDYLDLNLPGWRDEVDEKAMEDAKNIVKRAKERESSGWRLIPRYILTKNRTPEEEQEYKDALKLGMWKTSLKGKGSSKCSNEVRDCLDENLPGWRDEVDFDGKALETAKNIVNRANERKASGGRLIPRKLSKIQRTNEINEQEYKDAQKLGNWKQALKGKGNGCKCSPEVSDYLDENLPGWRGEEPQSPKSMELPAQPTKPKQKRPKLKIVRPEISELHKRYKTMTSSNLHSEFAADPELWHEYHEISEANESSFPSDEIPRNVVIKMLDAEKTRRKKVVVDMGCGKAQIAQHYANDARFTFKNYDHISFDANLVESCDIASVPLEDNSVDVAVLSLAMWGSNCKDYVHEAYRILETSGKLIIVEPTKRWSEKDGDGNVVIGKESVRLREMLVSAGFHIVSENIKKFTYLVCTKC